MSKTLGQIAYEAAYGNDRYSFPWDHKHMADYRPAWEAAASAVAEKCAKIAEEDDSFMMLQDWGLQSAVTQKGQNIALLIRSFAAPSQSPDEEAQSADTGSQQERGQPDTTNHDKPEAAAKGKGK